MTFLGSSGLIFSAITQKGRGVEAAAPRPTKEAVRKDGGCSRTI